LRVSLTIPGAPEGKRRPRIDTRGGFARIHATDADIKRERLIRQLAREAMDGRPPFVGPVRVDVEAIFEPPVSWSRKKREAALAAFWHTSKPDKDNVEKSILDGLNPDPRAKLAVDRLPFCLTDDAQVAAGFTTKRWGSPARVEVTISVLTPRTA
jgi:Holliday junction resolvase RusA-like endonuclease